MSVAGRYCVGDVIRIDKSLGFLRSKRRVAKLTGETGLRGRVRMCCHLRAKHGFFCD